MDDSPTSDLGLKYQKLAAEYSKIRAQTTVLKKALAEEQAKGNELKESMKEKDQVIRKLEQEVECLNFRNIQLTKRIAILQDDLEACDEKSKKTKNKVEKSPLPILPEAQSILNAELMSRIQENEKLHQQVYTAETAHKQVVVELTTKLENLQFEMNQQQQCLNEVIKKHESTIDRLAQERAKLEVILKNYEKELKESKLQIEISQAEVQTICKDLGSRLQETDKLLQASMPFVDTKLRIHNSLNVPVFLRQKQMLVSSLLVDFGVLVSELMRRLSDLHNYMEQRISLSEPDIYYSGPLKKFGQYLNENSRYLLAIEETYDAFTSKIQNDLSSWLEGFNLDDILQFISKYVRYLEKLLPYLILSIQAENRLNGSTPRRGEMHLKLQNVAVCIVSAFSKVERSLYLLSKAGSLNWTGNYSLCITVLIKRLVQSLSSLLLCFKEAKMAFSARVVLEHDLPTTTEDMKTTDDCILSSLVTVVSAIKKICTLVEDKLDLLSCNTLYIQRGIIGDDKVQISPAIASFRERGLKYMSLTQMETSKSVPYNVALRNNEALQSCADSKESLAQQLIACKSKLTHLEQDKEYWMLECQLLQAKYDKHSSSLEQDPPSEHSQEYQLFLKASINQLVTQVQLADSKAVSFHAECRALQQTLYLVEQELAKAKESTSELKDNLKTTVKSYEDQLSIMSELLANMNEKLTLQKDEIDSLRQISSNKGNKKSKGK